MAMAAAKGRVLPLLAVAAALAAALLYRAPFSKSLGGEGCSLLPHDHFWIASERVVTLGRVRPRRSGGEGRADQRDRRRGLPELPAPATGGGLR
uniref:OSJNBb0017I01.19 protein n=1 Tax=Oryza sativa subsp. japonica TaxID=39947 RepID=Q7XKD5_ORYSJ|nr:OSJNBb0017I01.19 [Oryza sativa Japonica Group]